MATVFKPTKPIPLPTDAEILTKNGTRFVRISEDGKTQLCKLSKDGAKYLKPAAKWYGKYKDADGKLCLVPLSPNKDAAKLMLANLLRKVENEKAGIRDPFEAHRKKPLTEHLDVWEESLKSNGRESGYVTLKLSRVRAVIDGCGWVFAGDMSADRLETFLAELRDRRPTFPSLPSGVEKFTVKETCNLLGGMTRNHLAVLIRRYQLPGIGKGKKRRFPRETVEALRQFKDRGRSAQTSNHYLQAVHQFARWLVANNRMERSPFNRLKPLNALVDTRRRRGELTPNEFGALLCTTSKSGTAFRGLSGEDRVMIYRVAVGTGFRAAELAALIPEYFVLDGKQPVVMLPAEFTKNRKCATQPIPAALVKDLDVYLSGRAPKKLLWPGNWVRRSADMLRLDLQAAGILVEVDGPEGTETRDFHALRACFISNVIRAGADLKQAMTLARHTDPRLTAGRYARTRLHDLGAVVDKLPEPTNPDSQSTQIAALFKTGTDSGCTPDVPRDVPTPGFSRGGLRIVQETDGSIKDSLDLPKSRKTKGKEGNLGLERAVEEDQGKRPRPDSNRGITVLQTAALPLGYEAQIDTIIL